MTAERFNNIIGELGDDVLRCEFDHAPKRRSRLLRIAAAAAALLVCFGAAFGIAKAVGSSNNGINLPDQYAFLADTSVPKDAVLPPAQISDGNSDLSYAEILSIPALYSEAESVCMLTVKNWLGENNVGTFFEANVERVYKGELPDSIVLFQLGNSRYQMEDSPLFTYGDKLLLGLEEWDSSEFDNAYTSAGVDVSMFYAAVDGNGDCFLIDHRGLMSYYTELQCPELELNDHAGEKSLIDELIEYFNSFDKAFAQRLSEYAEEGIDKADFPMHVYSIESIEDLFSVN